MQLQPEDTKPTFDPNAPFEAVKPEFDPNASYEAVPLPPESTLHQLARGAIETVPTIGAIGGSILGGASGFLGGLGVGAAPGAVVGGGLGYAGGKEVEGLLKHYLLDEEAPSTKPLDQAGRLAGNVAEGATYEMGGQILGKGVEKAMDLASAGANKLGGTFKEGASDILANNLGIGGKGANATDIRTVTDRIFDKGSIPLTGKVDPSKLASLNSRLGAAPVTSKASETASKVFDYGMLPGIALSGHPVTAAAGYAGKKVLQSTPGQRSIAIGLNEIGKLLKATPEVFGKYTPILQKAAERGPQALAAAHHVLQSSNPGYQEQTKHLNGEKE